MFGELSPDKREAANQYKCGDSLRIHERRTSGVGIVVKY